MRHALMPAIACIVAWNMLIPGTGLADLGPIAVSGGGASLKSPHESIRLELQDVTIRLRESSYTVEAIFSFFNTGDTTTEWIGFPKHGDHPDFVRFDTWVDGKKTAIIEEYARATDTEVGSGNASTNSGWLAQRVTFPGHAARIIRVSYDAKYNASINGLCATYDYSTGAYWKDAIETAAFTIDCRKIGGPERIEVTVTRHLGARKLTSKTAVRYEVRNLKPERLDFITIRIPFAGNRPE